MCSVVATDTKAAFQIYSTEKKPSVWGKDGLLSSGVIKDKDIGYVEVTAKKQKTLVIITGVGTKEP